jgi:predicted DNA-binding transcriptional regulator
MASRDQVIGAALMAISIVVVVAYGLLVFKPPDWVIAGMRVDEFMVKLTLFILVAGVFGLLAWIGYTLATTPPPKPIEEIEKEIEEELKKLERELKEEAKAEGGQG